MVEMKLIYSEAHKARWSGLEFEERMGIASLAAVQAERSWDPDRGQLSTLTVTAIRNAIRNAAAENLRRMTYDGIHVSTLLPSQIPPADSPNPERQAIFRDGLAKLPRDAKLLANLALHTPKAGKEGGDKNVLRSLKEHLRKNEGWGERKFRRNCERVRALWEG